METAKPMSSLFKRTFMGKNTFWTHIQKRMGSCLRSLKRRARKRKLADGCTMGGAGRLTNSLIDSLQVYYGKAIRNNVSNIEDMKNAVMAIFYHSTSTDAESNMTFVQKVIDHGVGSKGIWL